MKKELILIFIVLIGFSLTSCSSNSSTSNTKSAPTAEKVDETGLTKTAYPNRSGWEKGIVKDKNGNLNKEGDFLNGEKQGSWLTFYTKNGMIESVLSYEAGVLNGAAMKADDRGNVTDKMYYVMGELHGEKLKYNRTKIIERSQYIDGKLHGKRSLFYPSGKVQEESDFIDGKRNGKASWYDEEGNLKFEYEYKNGERVEQ